MEELGASRGAVKFGNTSSGHLDKAWFRTGGEYCGFSFIKLLRAFM